MDNRDKEICGDLGLPIRNVLECIMSNYLSSSEAGPHDRSLVTLFNDLQLALVDSPPVALRPTLRVRWSMDGIRRSSSRISVWMSPPGACNYTGRILITLRKP